jgi:YihY family inner membrane protein
MNRAKRALGGVVAPAPALRRLDRLQQRHAWLGFPVAVFKKFGDDQAGNLAALLAYYGFASLFPALLVFVTVLGIVLRSNAALQDRVLNSTFGQYPVIGPLLQRNVHSLGTTGFALAVGLILTFLAALGVATAIQNALNTVWAVPYSRRPGFPWNMLRASGLLLTVGLGLIVTSGLSGIASAASHLIGGAGTHVGTVLVSLLVNIGVFWLGFRLATAQEVTWRELFPGALASAVVWQVLQLSAAIILEHQLAHSKSLYGVFGIVLGLLAWLYLQAQVTLYAIEASVVHARKLWPRSLAPPPFTPQDRRAYKLYARAGQRLSDEHIQVEVDSRARPESDPARGSGGGPPSPGSGAAVTGVTGAARAGHMPMTSAASPATRRSRRVPGR